MSVTLTQRVLERAHELGFELADVAPAVPLPNAHRYEAWIERGFHGELGYMEKYARLRVDPRVLHEPTRTVVAVGMLYNLPDDGPIARYARNLDYHDVMRARLRELGAFIEAEAGAPVDYRPCVDSAPLLERDVALLAGLGWLGKSSMVIHQGLGSYLLLAELCVDVDLEVNTTPHPDRCGTCSRCIDACPTGAIVSPYEVDARRCISYLTIELKGPIPRHLRAAIGGHLFGCDVCQAVCPWNRKAPTTTHAHFRASPFVAEVQRAPEILLELDDPAFRKRFRGTPLFRTRRHRVVRNACVVLGNSGDRRHVPALSARLAEDPDALVRGHAAWALSQLGGVSSRRALDRARLREADDYVREEIRFALASI